MPHVQKAPRREDISTKNRKKMGLRSPTFLLQTSKQPQLSPQRNINPQNEQTTSMEGSSSHTYGTWDSRRWMNF